MASAPTPIPRLTRHSLHLAAAAGAQVPKHPRFGGQPGVVHLGLGAFHRAHQALVFDRLLGGGDDRWGVFGFSMRNPAVAESLAAQDGLYSVELADHQQSRWVISGALWRTAVATRDRQQAIQAMAAPQTRWITLTVTEKAYDNALGLLIAEGLQARRSSTAERLTIASCDNLLGNGHQLRALVLQAATGLDSALPDWVERQCAFPCSMVDRIVPASSDAQRERVAHTLGVADATPLAVEPFWEWIIDDGLADARDAQTLANAGVQVVGDVRPFEEAKLRLLNASHTAIACIGAVLGHETVAEAMADPDLSRFVRALMQRELEPHLQRPSLVAYREALLQRFANRALRHRLHQIASDTSQKIPQRLVPTVKRRLADGLPIEHAALAVAAWLRYLQGRDENGVAHGVSDPMGEQLRDIVLRQASAGQRVAQVMALSVIWGEVGHADGSTWAARCTHWLALIEQHGMRAALRQLQQAS